MSKQKGLGKIHNMVKTSSYSDKHNTGLENGIEYGFGLVLGVVSAAVIMLLLFFVLRSIIFAL